ncbi:MAG: rRNA (guanine527-N7)-methyltransferase [Solirubrobacteraceae bacterium]|jgi:16S rRNA (guanine527-N7)-methyltransferase|nr:rRNA (guanine527-N7)-methyltransferase [Solirubrobacteraceae bacterium]
MMAAADAIAVTHRLEALASRYGLSDGQIGQLRCLLEVLASDAHAPSTVTAARRAVDVHLADSLSALELDFVRAAARIADIGSGPGFPGLPLAVALPDATVSLLESSARRCVFIERAASAAGLRNAVVVAMRVEAWDAGCGEQDVVTARAVAPLAVLCEYAAPLLRLGGGLVVWRGRRDREAEEAAERAAGQLALESRPAVRSEPYPDSQEHHLHVYVKVGPTPARFPRRPGIASKRPLGVSS